MGLLMFPVRGPGTRFTQDPKLSDQQFVREFTQKKELIRVSDWCAVQADFLDNPNISGTPCLSKTTETELV